jgi:polar amino acid transport system permease protein
MSFAVISDNLLYFMVGSWPDGPIGGAALTVLLSLASALASAVLGLVLGIALSQSKGWPGVALRTVLGFLRAVPVLMLIFWIYFLLPVVFGLDVPGVGAVTVALALIGGAYLAHAVSAGINSLPRGQSEAARALGLGRWDALRLVILPQALPRMAPSFVNQWVALIKDTSLAYVIGVSELSFVATQVSNRVMVYPAEIYLFVAAVYYILCMIVEVGIGRAAARYRIRPA